MLSYNKPIEQSKEDKKKRNADRFLPCLIRLTFPYSVILLVQLYDMERGISVKRNRSCRSVGLSACWLSTTTVSKSPQIQDCSNENEFNEGTNSHNSLIALQASSPNSLLSSHYPQTCSFISTKTLTHSSTHQPASPTGPYFTTLKGHSLSPNSRNSQRKSMPSLSSPDTLSLPSKQARHQV